MSNLGRVGSFRDADWVFASLLSNEATLTVSRSWRKKLLSGDSPLPLEAGWILHSMVGNFSSISVPPDFFDDDYSDVVASLAIGANIEDRVGKTPLRRLFSTLSLDVRKAKMLLDMGASLTICADDGKTPLSSLADVSSSSSDFYNLELLMECEWFRERLSNLGDWNETSEDSSILFSMLSKLESILSGSLQMAPSDVDLFFDLISLGAEVSPKWNGMVPSALERLQDKASLGVSSLERFCVRLAELQSKSLSGKFLLDSRMPSKSLRSL